MNRQMSLVVSAAVVALVLVQAAAASPSTGTGSFRTGERVYLKQVLIPLYDWDTGKVIIGSTPVSCQYVETCAPKVSKRIPKAEIQPFYLVVYPMGAKVPPVQCTHHPVDNCPDHGPIIAAGAKQLVPSVYGDGVLGHDHISAPPKSKDYRVIGEPVLVLFKTRAAANELLNTRKKIFAAVRRGDAFFYRAPQYMFINYIVPSYFYDRGKPVKPKAMSH